MQAHSYLLMLLSIVTCWIELSRTSEFDEPYLQCEDLQVGQYNCSAGIDEETQEIKNCTKKGTALVSCTIVPGLKCDSPTAEQNGTEFFKEVPCVYTNGKSYRTAVLLSIFLGMLGVDRFYLGYYAIGLLKFCTMGLLFVGQFVDFILIATQVVGPADGSSYVMDYYAPRFSRMWVNNETYFHSSDL